MGIKSIGRELTAVLASRRFFYIILGFFVLEALWFALSAVYPMAFDEEFHFGVIQLFSEHGPFLATQPESADSFGAIIRDPSFLYHYLMTFPYRLVALFTENQTTIVIVLRLLNIALFTWSLVLFRKALLRAKMSAAFTHTALALFVLIPIVPQLAAHISYDNLLMPLVAWMCLLVAEVLAGLRERQLAAAALATLLLVAMASSIVKFESLPITATILLFTGFMVARTFRGNILRAFAKGCKQLSLRMIVVFAAVFIVLAGLVIQRYGVNMWTYHALKPSCQVVLSEQRCEAFGPWARNHQLEQTKGDVNADPLAYTWVWLQSLHYRLFFAVSGPANDFRNYPPLPLPAGAAIAITISGLVALLLYLRRVFAGHSLLVLFLMIGALYCGALWLENYSQFLTTGEPVAINGRYLLPILLLVAAVWGRALSVAFSQTRALKPAVAILAIVCFLQGGGVLTFIVRSDPNWYWPNQTVIKVNEQAQRFMRPVLFEGNKFY